jgi:hypothetical protein
MPAANRTPSPTRTTTANPLRLANKLDKTRPALSNYEKLETYDEYLNPLAKIDSGSTGVELNIIDQGSSQLKKVGLTNCFLQLS